MVDEINRRAGSRIVLDPDTLHGKDGQGRSIAARLFNGKVTSTSEHVNWLDLVTTLPKGRIEHQLVLINHAEITEVKIQFPVEIKVIESQLIDSNLQPGLLMAILSKNILTIEMPANTLAILACENIY